MSENIEVLYFGNYKGKLSTKNIIILWYSAVCEKEVSLPIHSEGHKYLIYRLYLDTIIKIILR